LPEFRSVSLYFLFALFCQFHNISFCKKNRFQYSSAIRVFCEAGIQDPFQNVSFPLVVHFPLFFLQPYLFLQIYVAHTNQWPSASSVNEVIILANVLVAAESSSGGS
jgi:hypothetical protein